MKVEIEKNRHPIKRGDAPKSLSIELSQGHKSREDTLLNYFCWFFSIVLWALIGLIIYYKIYEENKIRFKKCLISFIFYYIVYNILQYYSPTFKYLLNKDKLSFHAKMGEIFQMKPEVILKNTKYHYEVEIVTYTDDHGNTRQGKRAFRVWDDKDVESMKYKSFRDVSGLLVLNSGKSKKIIKAYVELEIKLEINFADTISYSDYEKAKTDFYHRKCHSGFYTQLNEEITVKGLKQHYLFKIVEKEPYIINIYWFIFFTLFTLGQIYKIYFSIFCIHKKFTIRKLISTRYDLGNPKYGQYYRSMNPQIIINNVKIEYEPNIYIYRDILYNPAIPSQNELKNSKKYKNKIPNYQIYKLVNGGIVKDNPGFKNLNDNIGNSYGDKKGFISGKMNYAESEQRLS